MERPASTVSVSVTQQFSASAERVFDAWLDPERVRTWMFGPAYREQEEVVQVSIDARTGGRFSFRVRRQGEEIDHVGSYIIIDRPRNLVFTWGVAGESENDFSLVTIRIVPDASGCELTLTHEMDARWADHADRTRAGWTRMLEVLAGTAG
jgi:uncharacterized protein YndB with AHSA1/START domain